MRTHLRFIPREGCIEQDSSKKKISGVGLKVQIMKLCNKVYFHWTQHVDTKTKGILSVVYIIDRLLF